jgi:hypothetical protein
MKQLWEVAGFLRGVQAQLRFGEFSQAPLRLLRLQMREDTFECDWVARPMDSWDMTLPPREREQKASVQALEDAMKLRDMLFGLIPEVRVAILRVFRQSAREPPRLIIAGSVTRQLPAVKRVKSPVQRAKLYGFKFWMNDGVLVPLESVDRSLSFAT